MEGAFDLMHYGHMNAFRLGAALGTKLVVGVNSSESIAECKGTAPIMTDTERVGAVRGCRFVDEVIERTPYVMTPEYLAEIMRTYDIDYVVHGDDPCLVNGEDVYGHVKSIGKYKSIPRTEGVSTTDIVGRMLLCSKEHHQRAPAGSPGSVAPPTISSGAPLGSARVTTGSRFMTTSQILRSFSVGMKPPPPNAKVVYMCGDWDLFNCSHVDLLREARALGDHLIVGVFSDDVVNQMQGANFPIMNLNERVLSVMGCSHVSDVLLDAPKDIEEDMIASLKISIVAHASEPGECVHESLYELPRKMGIFREIKCQSSLQASDVIARIHKNREQYEKKFEAKSKKEQDFWSQKQKESIQHVETQE